MQVASMHFKERAHVKLHDERLQRNLQEDAGQVRRQAARVARRARRLRGHARRRQGDPQPRARQPRRLARDVRAERHRPRRDGAVRRDAGRRQRAGARDRRAARGAQDHQVEVDGLRGVRARPRDRGRRAHRRRDRPRRVHPADQRLRAAVAHHRAGAAQVEGGGRRPLPRQARHAAQDRHRGALPRGARRAAPALPDRRHGHLRRQLLRRRDAARWCSSPTRATRR